MIAAGRPDVATSSSLAGLAHALETGGDMGLRERKKRARREALIDATQRLVERDGIDSVTVEAICEAAGVSTRTFFNYFESKDDALLGHIPWPVSPLAAARFVEGGPSGDLLADLEELLATVIEQQPAGHERFRRAIALVAHEPRLLARHMAWFESHRSEIAQLVAQRLGPEPSVDPETVASVAMFLVHATAQRWESTGAESDPRGHLAAVVAEVRALFTADLRC